MRKRETMLKWESEKERDYAEVREWERERLCWSERVRKRETMLKWESEKERDYAEVRVRKRETMLKWESEKERKQKIKMKYFKNRKGN